MDIHSIFGMTPTPLERIELLVIGGGAAGLLAAIEGARAGLRVVLVDENPIDPALMGLDVPHAFGQRMTGAVNNRRKMIEQVALSSPLVAEAFEAKVDVRLGVTAWGLFSQSEETRSIDGLAAGLSDGEKSWIAQCAHVIVAAGARDVMLGFEGWDGPGVMGAQALHALVHKYDASSSRTLLILGSGELALTTAIDAADHGLEVIGLVEPAEAIQGPAELAEAVVGRGIEILVNTTIRRAAGGLDGVRSATLVALDGQGRPMAGQERNIACDTICIAVAQTPNIELLAVAGCQMRFDEGCGAWAPVLSGHATTVQRLQAVGDCAELGQEAGDLAEAARRAARSAAAGTDIAVAVSNEPRISSRSGSRPAERWLDALVEGGGLDVLVCRCEAVTRAEVLDVSPPAYLNARVGPVGKRSLQTLLRDGPPHPDQIKRLTRCGMGECQGRRCREQTALLLARASGLPLGEIPLSSYRAPVRPLPLSVISASSETPAMIERWQGWFGIETQFEPYWEIGGGAARSGKAGIGEVAK